MERMKIWSCKIGEVDNGKVPMGADLPMRLAVEKAYKEITGEDAKFLFSGWGAELDVYERAALLPKAPSGGIVRQKAIRRISESARKLMSRQAE